MKAMENVVEWLKATGIGKQQKGESKHCHWSTIGKGLESFSIDNDNDEQ